MMDVRELIFRSSNKTAFYICGKCGKLYSPKIYACGSTGRHAAARRAAKECCAPRHCACGVEIDNHWTACATCRERHSLERAAIVTDYTGPVQSDQVSGSEWGDGYSSNVAELLEYCDGDKPAYCWPCKPHPLRLDVDSILEHACDDQCEDAFDQIIGADALGAAIDAFNAAQTCVSYYPDHTRVIVLDQERFDALLHPAAPTAEAGQ